MPKQVVAFVSFDLADSSPFIQRTLQEANHESIKNMFLIVNFMNLLNVVQSPTQSPSLAWNVPALAFFAYRPSMRLRKSLVL